MEIVSQTDCIAVSVNPKYKYKFKIGKPVKVKEEHAKKILANPNFSKQLNTSKASKK